MRESPKVRLEVEVPDYLADWLEENESGRSAEESAVEILQMIYTDSEIAERGERILN